MNFDMKKEVIYRCIGSDFNNGILACGFMTKPTKEHSQYDLLIDYYSWFFLISGSGFYYTKDSEKIPIQAGDIVQRLPGICHTTEIIPDGNWLEFFISFGRSTYDYLNSLDLLPIDTPVRSITYDEKTIQKFTRFLAQLKAADDITLPYLSLNAQEIILSFNTTTQETSSSNSQQEFIKEACRLLSADINKKISLETLAASMNMGYENFRKQFHKYTGSSPDRYRVDQRMKHAKLMLLSGVSIKEAALLTGYSDTYSFTKQFTNSVGISPGRYMKERSI